VTLPILKPLMFVRKVSKSPKSRAPNDARKDFVMYNKKNRSQTSAPVVKRWEKNECVNVIMYQHVSS
jgi:hypothetical protein